MRQTLDKLVRYFYFRQCASACMKYLASDKEKQKNNIFDDSYWIERQSRRTGRI